MHDSSPFKMTITLNALNHLGINLYSNTPAVLSEAVANAWDADAELVQIEIDAENEKIVIEDNGHGMTGEDVNEKYLKVGYQRRKDPNLRFTPNHRRPVMGRKGLGKLSLFSIAGSIEVYTTKDGIKSGFLMEVEGIKRAIEKDNGDYHPTPVDSNAINIEKGTKIVLSNLKKKLIYTEIALVKRLARRFSIIGDRYKFQIRVNKTSVKITDRGYFHKIQYIWVFGDIGDRYIKLCRNIKDAEKHVFKRPSIIDDARNEISGWIGSVHKSGDLKDVNINLNKIVLMVRGKLAQEDILEDFSEGGLYSKYLIGEIQADFFDLDDRDDIATSSRQEIFKHSPRYLALKKFIGSELKNIQSKWTELRNEDGMKKALEIPEINNWYKSLRPEPRKKAKMLFGKIGRITAEQPEQTKVLLKSGILAFESLRYKDNLEAIEKISSSNIETLSSIFTDVDDIEATLYYQIVKERIGIIEALNKRVDENAKEKVVQKYLFDHLWLLDPSWERATATPSMEKRVASEFGKIDARLSLEERTGRIDIKYRTTSGKHVIIELKRANVRTSTYELSHQIAKYRSALIKLVGASGEPHPHVECVCVVGRELKDWDELDGKTESEKMLKAKDARVVMYQELIENSYQAYREFLEKSAEAGKLVGLIKSIDAAELLLSSE